MNANDKKLKATLKKVNTLLFEIVPLCKELGIQKDMMKASSLVDSAYSWFVQTHA